MAGTEMSDTRNNGWLCANLALLPSGFFGGLFLFIDNLVDFVTKVFTRLLILSESQYGVQCSREVKQTFFAAFFFGAALALGLVSAFAFG